MGRLVTRREAAEELGYTLASLTSLMNRDPARWPTPVGREPSPGGRVWRLLYDLDELRATRGVTSRGDTKAVAGIGDEDERIQCFECPQRLRALPRHLSYRHGLTVAEYREKHGIPQGVPLVGEASREAMTDANRTRDLSHLAQYQTRERLAEQLPAAIDAHRATIDRRLTRERLAPVRARGVSGMRAANRARMDEAARASGYDDLRAAIVATRGVSAAQAARQIGVSPQTVIRRRAEWP